WIADLIRDKVKSLINAPLESAKKAFPYPFAQLPISLFQKMLDQVIDWATGGGSDSGEDPGGSGVERWRGTVKQALARVGLPTSSDYVEAWLRQIQTESGGNPKAVQGNIGDINNATGNLAQGLVQVIPPTFRANRDPSLPDDPFNPLANLVAGMRYAKATYGSQGMLRAIGKGHGYAEGGLVRPALFDGGGVLEPGVQFIDHQRTRPDYVLSEPQWQAMYTIAEKQSESGEIHMHMETRADQDPTIMGRRAGEALAWQMEKDLKGWFGGVGVHADDTQRTLGHGLFAASALRTGRALTLSGFMLFSTDEDRLLADRFLSGLLWDGEFGELEVTTGDLTLSTQVRLDGEVSHAYHGEHGVDLQVPLVAPDPFLYGDEQVARIYPAGTGTGLVWPLFSGPSEDGESLVSVGGLSYGARTLDTLAVVHNRGNAESHPVIRVWGEFPSGFTLTADTGETIAYPVLACAGPGPVGRVG
ncbi:hypothetical protein PIB30_104674, partial [Stylosanthes scabra]|nr:hypothetical protein [Stylosanthes scabra]